jgi:hypothetical protein
LSAMATFSCSHSRMSDSRLAFTCASGAAWCVGGCAGSAERAARRQCGAATGACVRVCVCVCVCVCACVYVRVRACVCGLRLRARSAPSGARVTARTRAQRTPARTRWVRPADVQLHGLDGVAHADAQRPAPATMRACVVREPGCGPAAATSRHITAWTLPIHTHTHTRTHAHAHTGGARAPHEEVHCCVDGGHEVALQALARGRAVVGNHLRRHGRRERERMRRRRRRRSHCCQGSGMACVLPTMCAAPPPMSHTSCVIRPKRHTRRASAAHPAPATSARTHAHTHTHLAQRVHQRNAARGAASDAAVRVAQPQRQHCWVHGRAVTARLQAGVGGRGARAGAAGWGLGGAAAGPPPPMCPRNCQRCKRRTQSSPDATDTRSTTPTPP